MKTGKITKDKAIRLIAVLVLAIGGMIWWRIGPAREKEPVIIMAERSSSSTEETQSHVEESEISSPVQEISIVIAETSEEPIVYLGVHVSGAVNGPDKVYLLPEGSRILDAIEAAGGAKDSADLSLLNLAEYIVDGERIFVPEVEGKSAAVNDRYVKDQFIVLPKEPESTQEEGSSKDGFHLTNINEATKIELMELPGIGESYAERIIQYRETMGPFGSIEEIMNVSGIGESKFEKLKPLITVD